MSQNWIGGTRPGTAVFVPPPPAEVEPCMADLERFLHDQQAAVPILLKAAYAHVQFETIHPFLDGNGRVGRLLITFLLCLGGVLREPMLYLSLFFKQNRQEYYRLLAEVRTTGNWEAWVEFFLTGVTETAEGAVATARRLLALVQDDHKRIQQGGRAAGSALRVQRHLSSRPLTTIREASEKSGLSFRAAGCAMDLLTRLGIAREVTGRQRDRIFAYQRYLDILTEGTEPL